MIGTILTGASVALLLGLMLYGWRLSKQSKVAGFLVILGVLAYAPVWETMRPHASMETVTGSDVIRRDNPTGGSVDVRYIYTQDTEYRNEDTWWWLKYDTGNVTNRANQMENSGQEALFVSNGIRFAPISAYPNVIAIDPIGITWLFFTLYMIAWALPLGLLAFIGKKIAGRGEKKIA